MICSLTKVVMQPQTKADEEAGVVSEFYGIDKSQLLSKRKIIATAVSLHNAYGCTKMELKIFFHRSNLQQMFLLPSPQLPVQQRDRFLHCGGLSLTSEIDLRQVAFQQLPY